MHCGGESLLCCTFCLRVLCFRHMYCPCSEAIERRRQVACARRSVSSAGRAVTPVANLNTMNTSSVSSGATAVVKSTCLSPGPTYDGPPIDRSDIPWPLSECPDWPISDSWRDFAFAPVVFSARLPLDIDTDSCLP